MENQNYVNISPSGIEEDSMEIISNELAHLQLPPNMAGIIKRIVHTTADFEYAHLFEAHPLAIENCKRALTNSCKIYADTRMITVGVSEPSLNKLGCSIHTFVHDEEVITKAKTLGITRSICGINKAASDPSFKVFIIGNAPTALVRICELAKQGVLKPDMIIGVPVGFVGAAESKEMLKNSGLPYIIIRGRKGGSTVGVSILNAIMYELVQRD